MTLGGLTWRTAMVVGRWILFIVVGIFAAASLGFAFVFAVLSGVMSLLGVNGF